MLARMISEPSAPQTVDIRVLGPCVERKAHVLGLFDALAPGASLVVVSDHLPNGLRRHLEELRPSLFGWAILDEGPQTFRVEITRQR
jgi:uncharacterized protein (DUF2249 family)